VPIEGRASETARTAPVGIPFRGCTMPHQIGASSVTGQSNRVGSSPQPVVDDLRARIDARAGTESPTSDVSVPDVAYPSADQAAAANAKAPPSVHRDDAIWVTECAWCRRVRSVAGDWHTLAPVLRAGMNTERTHGVCPPCAHGLMARADDADRQAR
jgi:hypothetical protein